ncbi:hypothetical protein BDM02DRAFT_3132630 [Thelephora ganbajun]|uniref:Uncharacterized protein n=1 Tax=Thelephora ganbajun TaxID=370292 RepID=A0ACB6Z0P2_THEGA|nr:hypothetical protein BDM02DRAFT_3132630 [Thelephora ganbajun]
MSLQDNKVFVSPCNQKITQLDGQVHSKNSFGLNSTSPLQLVEAVLSQNDGDLPHWTWDEGGLFDDQVWQQAISALCNQDKNRHWGHGVVDPVGTLQVICRNIMNFPKESTHDVPEWLIEGKWYTEGTPVIFPRKVPVMFLSGSFKGLFVMSQVVQLQCSQSVKLKMSQNHVPEMFLSGIFGMSLKFRSRYTTFGKFSGNSGDIARTFKMFPVFQFP